jgi:hypothetical protein
LSFAVTAGETYWFKFAIAYQSQATTTGSRWSIQGPASPTRLSFTANYTLTVATSTFGSQLAYDAPAASNTSSAVANVLGGNIARIEGFVRPSASGTVIARFASEIANSTTEQVIIWIKQDCEEELICKLVPDAVPVRGSMKTELKEKRLLGFAHNEFRVLVTKMKIAQFGLNYQNCRNQVFASLDFSFESLYQSIRRSYRFGQTQDVNIYIITTDTMANVSQAIKAKQVQFEEMQREMTKAINKSTAEHEQIRKLLNSEFGIHRVTRNDIIRYKLWKECDGISL